MLRIVLLGTDTNSLRGRPCDETVKFCLIGDVTHLYPNKAEVV